MSDGELSAPVELPELLQRDFLTRNGKLCAAASRNLENAQAFALERNIPHAFGSYQALAQSEEVDAVYIATPHSSHAENAILCMKHQKPVLCEKPFAVNAKEVESMIMVAREQDVLLMEGMWSRFPHSWINLGIG